LVALLLRIMLYLYEFIRVKIRISLFHNLDGGPAA
jgi:hypothetical protein